MKFTQNFLCLLLFCSISAEIRKISQIPMRKGHEKKETFVPFNPATFIDVISLLIEDAEFLIGQKENIEIFNTRLEIIPLSFQQRQALPWLSGKQIVLIETTYVDAQKECSKLKGVLPTPTNSEELAFLRKILAPKNEKIQLLDIDLKGGNLVYPNGLSFLDKPNITFTLRKKRQVSAEPSPKTLKSFLVSEYSLLRGVDLESEIYKEIPDVNKRTYQICVVPVKIGSLLGGNDDYAQELAKMFFYDVAQVERALKSYLDHLYAKGFSMVKVGRKEDLAEKRVQKMPKWFAPLTAILFEALDSAGDLEAVHDLLTSPVTLQDITMEILLDTELINQNVLVLSGVTCEISSVPSSKLKCLELSEDHIWIKQLLAVRPTSDGKRLLFDTFAFSKSHPENCGFEMGHTKSFFRLTEDCCMSLHIGVKVEEDCPTISVDNPANLMIYETSDLSLHTPFFSKSVSSCAINTQRSSGSRLTSCDMEFSISGQDIHVRNTEGSFEHHSELMFQDSATKELLINIGIIAGSVILGVIFLIALWLSRRKLINWLCKKGETISNEIQDVLETRSLNHPGNSVQLPQPRKA